MKPTHLSGFNAKGCCEDICQFQIVKREKKEIVPHNKKYHGET